MSIIESLLSLALGFVLGWTGRTAVPLLWEDFKDFIRPTPKNWWDAP